MRFYCTSKKLFRLSLREFEMMKESRKMLHISNAVSASKKLNSFIKGKSESSTRWLKRQAKDPYVSQAMKDGYRCRSAYKLLEMNDKFNFLTPGVRVVDCGSSPGSWTQVAIKRVKCNNDTNESGIVIAIDLLDIKEIPGCITLGSCDFTQTDVQQKIIKFLPHGQADVVMSDMAPASSGNKKLDHFKIMDLNRSALEFAKIVLSDGGCFLCKLWDGNETFEFIKEISDHFSFCKLIKPKASRTDSSEIYIFSKNFQRINTIKK